MITKIRKYFVDLLPGGLIYIKDSAVARNAASLYIIQFADLILPLITIPYVVRVLGPGGFGVASFCISLVAYFSLFVDYGFSMSATREISVRRDDKAAINKIFTTTIITKGLIFLAGLIVFTIIVLSAPKLHQYGSFMFAAYLVLLGNVLFPQWLYQGLEKMKFLAVSSIITKICMVAAIFLLIPLGNKILIYILILSGAQILNGIICLARSLSEFDVKFVKINLLDIKESLIKGWSLFLSTASLSIYAVGNPFILGLFVPPEVVGYFSVADKVVRTVVSILWPITQAVYPRFSQLAIDSKELLLSLSKKMFFWVGGFGLLLSLILAAFAPIIVQILLGSGYHQSIYLIRVMSPMPFLIAISNILGVQIMLTLGKERAYTKIILLATILNFITVFALASRIGAYASAIALLVAEVTIVLGTAYYVETKIRKATTV